MGGLQGRVDRTEALHVGAIFLMAALLSLLILIDLLCFCLQPNLSPPK